MAGGIGASLKAFWHTMTSYDRHASHDSPYRMSGSGQGIGRNPPLSSIATGGFDSTRESLHHPYQDDLVNPASRSTTALAATQSTGIYSPPNTGSLHGSPTQPYTPGRRSLTLSTAITNGTAKDVPLQDFGSDGLPPPPPVAHSWARIIRWTETNYPELFDQLCDGATVNDINELEFELDCTLPLDVRESIAIHDGQERGGMPTGIVFGAMLLDCEEILDEWRNWKTVNQEFLAVSNSLVPTTEVGPSKSKAAILARQDSCPDGSVQKVYVHPGWIPLARDWGGNNIAVDLAPGPNGKWGQVILCGRDYDCKYVIARSWAAFLAMVADDMESPYWYVDEDSNELKLKDPRAPRREPSYFDILRVRSMQRYKKIPRRPSAPNSQQGSAPGSPSTSIPNGNGVDPVRGRGSTRKDTRSSPGSSLKPQSRLSCVTEEAPTLPLPAHTKRDSIPGNENGSAVELSPTAITVDGPTQDKAATAIKSLEDISLDSKPLDKDDPLPDVASTVSRPPAAVNRRSTEEK